MTRYYESGFHNGVVKFAQYLKEHSFVCDPGDWSRFQAIDADDIDDLVEEFLSKGEYL